MRRLTRVVGFALAWVSLGAAAVHTAPGQPLADGRSTLVAGEELMAGAQLESPDGRHVLEMQPDGNLVLRAEGGVVTWAAGTTVPGSVLGAQDDGNIVVRAPGGVPVWSSETSGIGPARLELHDDGRLVVHDAAGGERWSAPPRGPD